ncbi:MAG TPA: DUF2934 domain-containing protein [Candidatus Competibacteraceae bacterium]|nr:MAG: DUF2934 domain-containing protein [Candidatus Competibacteraceae bacterium]HOB60954.1 DUF2934 domain-containing protein [Candidatus Competibacteraceae bacterium]HQA25601.1 DUF2934 domain-containing protein [Candidatus Competibacteraceae bacterium]HQD56452.1 DUF2934 domain-containing protein [Candidatus Competibacteraceae bacterium]
METDLEHEIRDLAYHIWLTAGNDFSRQTLDFWVMAEQMVIEMTADSIRQFHAATTLALENAALWPSALRALYLYRIRELAHCMWSVSAEHRNQSLDYWLAAEKHLRALSESAMRATGGALDQKDTLLKTLESFSPANHLEQVRQTAYQLWESAEKQQSSALDFWLAAEQKVLDSLIASGPAAAARAAEQPTSSGQPKRTARRRPRQPSAK